MSITMLNWMEKLKRRRKKVRFINPALINPALFTDNCFQKCHNLFAQPLLMCTVLDTCISAALIYNFVFLCTF